MSELLRREPMTRNEGRIDRQLSSKWLNLALIQRGNPVNNYRILRVDAFEWLSSRKTKSIHAVVTDPPYGIIEFTLDQLVKRENGRGGIWRLPQKYDGHERSPMPRFTVLQKEDHERITGFHARLAPLLFRVLVPGGHAIISCQNLFLHLVIPAYSTAGFETRGQIARIVKTLRGGDRPKGAHIEYADLSVIPRSCWEPWLIFRRPCEGRVRDNLKKWNTGALRRPHRSKPFQDLILSGPARGLEKEFAPHPSLKPQAFMRQLVWASLPLGKGLILDPFMGAGSTIAAAEFLGLKSIGLEMNKDFFRTAQRAVRKLANLRTNGLVG
jgi:DNA modification methylase